MWSFNSSQCSNTLSVSSIASGVAWARRPVPAPRSDSSRAVDQSRDLVAALFPAVIVRHAAQRPSSPRRELTAAPAFMPDCDHLGGEIAQRIVQRAAGQDVVDQKLPVGGRAVRIGGGSSASWPLPLSLRLPGRSLARM